MTLRRRILATELSGSVFFLRLMVGGVFLSEGILKFVYPLDLGAGHFLSIGFPLPYFSACVCAIVEIVCGACVLLGLLTRVASFPLFIITTFSIAAIQLPIMAEYGFWAMLHSARVDWCMLLGSAYLLLKGGGRWSLDRKWWKS